MRKIFGGVLLAFFILSAIVQINLGSYNTLVWFCYIGVLLAGIGFFMYTPFVYAYISVGLLVQLPFAVDLLSAYLGYPQTFGYLRYDPTTFSFLHQLTDMFVHFFSLPLAIAGLWFLKVGEKKETLYTLVVVAFILYGLGWITGTNCAEQQCFFPIEGFNFLIWIVVGIGLPLLVFYLIVYPFHKYIKK